MCAGEMKAKAPPPAPPRPAPSAPHLPRGSVPNRPFLAGVKTFCLGPRRCLPPRTGLIQAHNVPVSPDNASCLRWLQPRRGSPIFHGWRQWPVCPQPPYAYYGPAILTHIANYSKRLQRRVGDSPSPAARKCPRECGMPLDFLLPGERRRGRPPKDPYDPHRRWCAEHVGGSRSASASDPRHDFFRQKFPRPAGKPNDYLLRNSTGCVESSAQKCWVGFCLRKSKSGLVLDGVGIGVTGRQKDFLIDESLILVFWFPRICNGVVALFFAVTEPLRSGTFQPSGGVHLTSRAPRSQRSRELFHCGRESGVPSLIRLLLAAGPGRSRAAAAAGTLPCAGRPRRGPSAPPPRATSD